VTDVRVEAVGTEDRQVSVLDVVASPLLAPEATPAAPAVATRELRLALVCYGGVSLAIYMHGITKELEKLVAASVAYERDQRSNPFGADDTAAVYWSVLKRLDERTHVRTRVVVDVVSGTSAGGINGVFLAVALARNRSQEPLRSMWMEKGDITRLLAGRDGGPLLLKAPGVVSSLLRRRPLLDGSRISRWLREALSAMGRDGGQLVPGVDSLLGPEERLQLFVPVTDFFGYDVRIPADDPAWVRDRTHRHVLHFVHDHRETGCDQLSSRWDDALAFGARATSSFPAAFPPVSLADYQRAVGTAGVAPAQRDVLFAPYALSSGASPEMTHFVDGGVLDNKPFATTVAAIKLRPAATEVDRRLLYVEPDPSTEPGGSPEGEAPGLLQTVIGGYAGIPRQEPIIGDLTDLAVHNADVSKIRDIIETSFDPMRQRVRARIAGSGSDAHAAPTTAQVTAWRRDLTRDAQIDAGFAYPTYLRLRIRAVIDDFAKLIAERRGYPLTSSHALFVGRVLRAWAETGGLLQRAAEGTHAQRALVDTLDIAHHERHIRFLLAALGWWYDPPEADAPLVPTRVELDATKRTLYEHLERLHDLAGLLTSDDEVVALTERLFGGTTVADALDGPIDDFVDAHAEDLGALQDGVARILGPHLTAAPGALDGAIVRLTSSWTDWARSELLTRHLGFAYWDVIVFPVEAVSGVNERDHVEVMRLSPNEATAIATPAEKDLEGAKLGHFGAFFSRRGRENDYFWGRLDGMERLLALLLTPPGRSVGWTRSMHVDDEVRARQAHFSDDCRRAAAAVVRSERRQLLEIQPTLELVRARVDP
jgi:patatin-related protein